MAAKKRTTKKRRKRRKKPKKVITCGTCGGEGHNARSCEKTAPEVGRQVFTHEVWVHGTYWAPYGSKGWSAVRVKKVGRKIAKVERVKPKTQEVVAQGKVRMDELLKRDPKQEGRDRPKQTPDEMFADYREQKAEMEAKEAKEKEMKAAAQEKVESPVKTEPAPTPEEEAARMERLNALFDLIDDGSTVDDW